MRSKKLRRLAGCLTMVLCTTLMLAQHASADIYVVRVGDGSGPRSSASTAAFIDLYSTTGSLLATLSLPQAASGFNQPLTLSGTATSEGFLAISPNGQFLTLGGYAATPGLAGIASTNAADVNRVIGRVDLFTSAVDTSTALTADSFNTSNIRSVATTNGTDFWAAGNGSGGTGAVRYTTLGGGGTTEQVADAPNNARVVKIYDGQLYVGSGSGDFRGVSEVGSGLPTTMETTTLLPGFDVEHVNNPSTYDYWFSNDTTLYVADDRSLANGGGIQKWELSAGTWGLSYVLDPGGTGVRGLSGVVSGGTATLFATTTQTSANNLISIVDTGAASAASVLTSAPADTVFRGLVFAGELPPPGDGDFDGDGIVDGHDFLLWQRGGSPNPLSQSDLNAWEANFGSGAPLSAIAAVPEPSSLGLLLLAAVPMVLRRR